MPKFRLLVDVDSVVEEAEHLEDLFKDGIEADNEEEAERLVEAKVKELMYGGPYYTVTDEEDDLWELEWQTLYLIDTKTIYMKMRERCD